MNNLRKYSPLIMRLGLAIVFLWFGFSQIKNPMMWVGLLPKFASSLGSPITLIYLNGAFEILLATILSLGLFVRFFSALAFLHLSSIVVFAVGYGSVGTRDFGLAMLALALFFYGYDELTLDSVIFADSKEKHPNHVHSN